MNGFSLGSDDCDRRPRLVALATLLGSSGVLVAVTLVGWWGSRPAGPLLALDLVAGALSLLSMPLMLWRPVAATAVLTVLAAVSPAATPPATIGALQVARRRRVPVAVGWRWPGSPGTPSGASGGPTTASRTAGGWR
ncbi:hypothetical protein [Micromonospora sp. RTGN7]|uniref:hypothetical protein n=1 Tax=Micromonospora sp. RTGN7 TaxID=3016526 RepID=UPI0029FF4A41|nr:hypothetical protein [Micromonospora sp. RTGN7]